MQTSRVSQAGVGGVTALFVAAFTVGVLAQSTGTASVVGRLTGTWKENEAKKNIGSMARVRFRRSASEGIEEIRGSDVAPNVQTVTLDGKTYPIEGDRAIAWKQIDASTFERKLSGGGQLLTTRNLRISTDGKTLTEATNWNLPNGKTRLVTIVYQRVAGEPKGLAAIWKPQSYRSSEPDQEKYEALGNNTLKALSLNGATYAVALDGKPVPVTGGTTIIGTMIAAKAVDDSTIETTSSRNGTVTGKSTIAVSPNGKTLTVTTTEIGPNASLEPSITVFEKQ